MLLWQVLIIGMYHEEVITQTALTTLMKTILWKTYLYFLMTLLRPN